MVMSSAFMHDYFCIILLFSYIHIQKQHYITCTTYYTIRHNLIAVGRAGIPDQDGSGNRTIFNRQLTASVPLVYVCMNWPHINVHSQLHA